MAGILSGSTSPLFRRCMQHVIFKFRDSKRTNYYVLLPEIPPDTPETNSLLQKDCFPDFTKVSRSNYVNAIGKLALEFESGICRIEENIENGDVPKTIDSLLEPIEKLSAPLDFTIGNMNTFSKLMCNDDLEDFTSKLRSRVSQCKSRRFSSLIIYNSVKEIYKDKSLSESQKHVSEKYLLESRFTGIELSSYNKAHLDNVAKNLARHKDLYRRNLNVSTSRFKHTLHHSNMVQNFPDALVRKMASDCRRPSQGPWNVTLEPEVCKGFLENCSDKMLRWNVWQAYVSRASSNDSDINNSIHIEELRLNRNDLAKLLGYKNYVELSMETKMAGTVDNVKSFIKSLHLKSKPVVVKELLDLQEFALQNDFNGQLELWDIPYWRSQQNKALYSLDQHEISQYFPLDHVLDGLFNFCRNMFGVQIKDSSEKVTLWHKDVKYYEIYDENGTYKGAFFLDAFQRPGLKNDGSWLDTAKSKNDAAGFLPLCYLIFNFSSPPSGQKAVLTFEELTLLFKKFGHLLLTTLSEVPYSETSGLNNLEWDAVEVLPFFMAHWLSDYNTISKISRHTKTDEPLPKALHDKIKKSQKHMAGYDLNNQLYLSALDLELHLRKDYWLDIMRNVWAEYIPFPIDKKDSHPCSFKEIFCDQFPASYYCKSWAQMIAADAFGAFHEVGLSNQSDIEKVGRRFKDTFLSSGGGCSTIEVFRRFRGRDPSLDSLLVNSRLREIKTDE